MEPSPALREQKDFKQDGLDPAVVAKGRCDNPGMKLVVYRSDYEYEDISRANRVSVDIIL